MPRIKCCAPPEFKHQCSKSTIQAHTVSRSSSLGAIAREGKVYSPKNNHQNFEKNGGRIVPQLTGWKEASTFPGFCSFHDDRLFKPLEGESFSGSIQQCFLLAYRAIAREMFLKSAAVERSSFRYVLSRRYGHEEYASVFNQGMKAGLKDAKTYKKQFDERLIRNGFRGVRAVLIEFSAIFPIQCAGAYFPTHDVFGTEIQEISLSGRLPKMACLMSFAADRKSYLCIVWLATSDTVCEKLISSILSTADPLLVSTLASLLLQTTENCHFSPDWYESLSGSGKLWVERQMMSGPAIDPDVIPPARSNGPDHFPGITVSSIRRVGD